MVIDSGNRSLLGKRFSESSLARGKKYLNENLLLILFIYLLLYGFTSYLNK